MASPPNPAQPLKSDTSAEPSQDDVPDIATEKVRMPLGKGADAPSTAPSSSSVPSPRSHDAKNESNLPVVLSGVLALGIVCAIVGCLVTSIIPSGTSCLQWLPVLFLVSLLWFRAFLAWKPRRFWKVFCHGFLYSARNVLVWGAIVALPVVLSVGTDQTSTTNAATTATMVNQVPWSVGTDQTTTQVVKTSFSYWLTVLNIALVVEIVVSLLQFCRRGCDVPNKFAPAKVRLLFTKKRFFRDFWDNILSFALTAFVWGALAVLPVAWSIGVAEIQKNPLSYCVPVLSIAVVFGIGVSVLRMFLWWSEAPTELPKDDGFSILPKAQSVATYFSNQAKKVRERSNSLTGRGATRLYGVYGQRGVGKSTFLRQIEAKLETDECIIAIYYDAWKWQTTGNAPEWTLLTQIFANPRVRNVAWFKKPLLLNLVSLVTTLRVTFGNTNAQIQIDSTTSAIRRIELALLAAGYRRLFKFLEKCGISVLLLIDEVDRCDRLYFQGVLALWQRYLKEN
ncbi:MAG: KAP family NTPase, partial [Puniceicoccales bacterium]|nr:KAP family NTPase [Puniceicoccales bacterium]